MPSPAPRKRGELHVAHPDAARIHENDEEEHEPGPERAQDPLDARIVDRPQGERSTPLPGRTILSGISRCSRSVRVMTTSTQQKNAADERLEREAEHEPAGAPEQRRAGVTSGRRGERERAGAAARAAARSSRGDRRAGRRQPGEQPDEAAATSTVDSGSARVPADRGARRSSYLSRGMPITRSGGDEPSSSALLSERPAAAPAGGQNGDE